MNIAAMQSTQRAAIRMSAHPQGGLLALGVVDLILALLKKELATEECLLALLFYPAFLVHLSYMLLSFQGPQVCPAGPKEAKDFSLVFLFSTLWGSKGGKDWGKRMRGRMSLGSVFSHFVTFGPVFENRFLRIALVKSLLGI